MKKQLLSLGALFVIASGLYAASVNDVVRSLESAASTFGLQMFNKNLTIAQQNASLTVWDKAFAQAKTFVFDNSKDLLRKQDPILLDVLSKVEKVNMDLINTIKVIRGSLPNAPISRLLGVSGEAKKSVEKLYTASFTLSGKKDSSALLKSVARFIEDISKQLYDVLAMKG